MSVHAMKRRSKSWSDAKEEADEKKAYTETGERLGWRALSEAAILITRLTSDQCEEK